MPCDSTIMLASSFCHVTFNSVDYREAGNGCMGYKRKACWAATGSNNPVIVPIVANSTSTKPALDYAFTCTAGGGSVCQANQIDINIVQ